MSLRTRLAVMFGVVALGASVLVGTFAYRSTETELADANDDFLRARVDEVSTGLRDGPQDRRPGRNSNNDGFRTAADDDSIIQLTGPNGISVSTGATLPVAETTKNRQFSDVVIDDEPYRMVTQKLGEARILQVARSTAEDERVLERLLVRFALIALICAAVAAAIGWYIAQRATSPLRRLATVANNVAQTRDLTLAPDFDDVGRSDEIGSLAASFRSMLDALESSRAQQHRLIEDAGHELRTPLTSMRANVELLERATELPVDQRNEIVTAIKSELIELNDLFTEMIDLATDQGVNDLVLDSVDLAQVARAVAERWGHRTDRDIDVVGDGGTVMGDSAMLERAVTNLVSNAVKFSPSGSPVTIALAAGSVCVRDCGPGVPVADRAQVFDRFHRSATTRSMPGSGLGLSIVAQIVERHGGEVWVSDAPGGGAEVGFRLQALDSSAGSSGTSAGSSGTSTSSSVSGNSAPSGSSGDSSDG